MKSVYATDCKLTKLDVERIRDIRSGMVGAFFGPHDKETFAFAFLDYLHLFFQPTPKDGPIAFAVWHGKSCIYSTFRDRYYTASYPLNPTELRSPDNRISISPKHDLWLTIHHVKTRILFNLENGHQTKACPNTSLQERILPTHDKFMSKASQLLLGTNPDLGVRLSDLSKFQDTLVDSLLNQQQNDYPGTTCKTDTEETDIEELDYRKQVLPILDPFRNVLDDVFKDFAKKSQFPHHKPDLGNIFCVVRTVPSGKLRFDHFPYTLGLLLSNTQKEAFKEWCGSTCNRKERECPLRLTHDGTCLERFEIPLGPRSRSAADVTFCSGNIDFGRTAGDKVWDKVDPEDTQEQQRVLIENRVYPREAESGKSDVSPNNRPSLYYLPVHVNGVPWLALFTFSSISSTNPTKRAHRSHF